MAGRDTRTRYQGVYARHQEGCAVETLDDRPEPSEATRVCNCSPSYYGKVYDPQAKRHRVTKRYRSVSAARSARKALQDIVDVGGVSNLPDARFKESREAFVKAAREGRALNKHGRRYKRSAIDDVDEVLRVHAAPRLDTKRLAAVTRKDIQSLVDELSPTLSGSRVRSVVNAIRSLYRWAQARDMVDHDPAALVLLPAMAAEPRDRIATPREFADLIAVLDPAEAVPYALAAYGMGRRAQVLRIRWADIDLEAAVLEWGVDPDARKSRAARRVVPIVQPLLSLLRREYIRQGRPAGTELVCPPRYATRSGLLAPNGLKVRAWKRWAEAGLKPIRLQECRHTAATWLDAAGVSPKVSSVLMGHSTPEAQAGAAQITLARYTHTLPDHVEEARRQLNEFFAKQTRTEARGA